MHIASSVKCALDIYTVYTYTPPPTTESKTNTAAERRAAQQQQHISCMQRSGVRDCDCVWPAAARALVPTPNLNTARVTRTARQHSSTRVRLTALARACHVHRLRVPSAPPDAGGRRAPTRGPRLAWLHHACCCAGWKLEATLRAAPSPCLRPASSQPSAMRCVAVAEPCKFSVEQCIAKFGSVASASARTSMPAAS